jgi:phosphatidate cytidylyltransferase
MQAGSPSKPAAAVPVAVPAFGPGAGGPTLTSTGLEPAGPDAPPPRNAPQAGNGGLPKDLLPRVLSGVALAALALALLYWGLLPFTGLVLAVALAMSWEWGHIVRQADFDTTFIVHASTVAISVVLAGLGLAALGIIVTVVGTLIVLALRFGERARLSGLGVLYVGLPCVSLLWLRGDEPYGFLAVLFVIMTVVVTDTGAYAAGRTIGGPKLWPRVSPNKTWSGLIGGVCAAGIAGALFARAVPGASPALLGCAAVVCGCVAQAGDLMESALKRAFGVKDASQLIPGHGGFMDRMDGLVGAAAIAALFALALNMHAPARALLLWH